MKKKLKIIGIIIGLFVILYSILLVEEVIRFNNHLGAKPFIIIDTDKVSLTSSKGIVYKSYLGLGYTIKYEYYVIYEDNADYAEIVILGGEFRLFDKIVLSAWAQ